MSANKNVNNPIIKMEDDMQLQFIPNPDFTEAELKVMAEDNMTYALAHHDELKCPAPINLADCEISNNVATFYRNGVKHEFTIDPNYLAV